MKQMYKYKLDVACVQSIRMPTRYIGNWRDFASVGLDPSGDLCLWCVCDNTLEHVLVTVVVAGTGMELPECDLDFIGSVTVGALVWHVFVVARI